MGLAQDSNACNCCEFMKYCMCCMCCMVVTEVQLVSSLEISPKSGDRQVDEVAPGIRAVTGAPDGFGWPVPKHPETPS